MRRVAAAVAALTVVALAGPMLAPHDPDEIVDVPVLRFLPPGSEVHVITLTDGTRFATRRILEEKAQVRAWRGERERIFPRSDIAPGGLSRERFLLGTDGFGRDLLSRILYGARLSLGVTFLAVLLGVGIGATAGGIAGYLGGLADAGIMRLVDILHAIPKLFLFLLCAAVFGPSALLVGIVLGLTGWLGIARITRGQVLSIREREFVDGARASGLGPLGILFRHVLPHCAAPVGLSAVLLAADAILTESSLSFIGLGVQPPAASWGSLVAAGQTAPSGAWWILAFPGLAIVSTVAVLHTSGRPAGRLPGGGL